MLKKPSKRHKTGSRPDRERRKPDMRMPEGVISIQTVAGKAGVSIATVSRVLNGTKGKMSEATRGRVLSVIKELDYRPSRVGSALRSGRSRLVALMVQDPANAYNGAIANSVERQLRERGKILLFCNTQEDPKIQDELLREMRAQLVSGVVMLGAVESEELYAYIDAGEPIVFVNRRLKRLPPGMFVGIDNYKAGQAVAELFSARQFRKAWLIHGPLASPATSARVDGFVTTMKKRNTDVSIRKLGVAISRMDAGYALATAELTASDRPDAIFCTTDEIAYGVHKRCRELGLSVPRDIHLFGFDGNPLNEYLAPWLSTIRVPYESFGSAVTEMLEYRWNNDKYPAADTILPFRETIAD